MTLPDHYDPETVEQHVKDHWADVDAYEQSTAATADGEPFYFVDGPPNTSGEMHCGTAWGKVLKDAFLRYYRMQGRDVVARPGYDTHGLPVERRVEAELGVESKQDVEEYGVDSFVEDCRAFVERQREGMDEEFADLGVWMDWADPYQTMDTEYMEVVWETFVELSERDLLERERRVVNTCPDCETSVAETRLGYETREATAAYVGFELTEREGWLVTWTTTPWTVTANQFVAVDREATYVAVETDGRVLYVAADCLDDVLDTLDVDGYDHRAEYTGEEMVGWSYENPLAESLPADSPAREGVVAHADYVSLDRTGLVHSAPGFGEEDFHRGRELDLPAYAPLDESGVFSHDGKNSTAYEGTSVDKLREMVLSDLEEAGALLGTHDHDHEYPHCPRCDTQVLYRATDQWVVQVSAFKDDLLAAVDDVGWSPSEARENRFRPMVEDAPDWNVSRQRYWGTPVPVWRCQDCGHDVVVRDAADLAQRAGLEAVSEDLHRPTVDGVTVECPDCGGTARRESDVLDVWFDSAVASWATAGVSPPETPEEWPADLVVEGHDQTRGWFLMQLYMGVVFGDRAPYEEVVMHGFANLDGRAMSKSSGHVLRPPEVVDEHGRDALRGHLLTHNPTSDVSLDSEMSGVATLADELDVVWNVYRFALLYMDMDDYVPDRSLATTPEERTVLDNWVLSRLQTTVETVEEAMENRRTDRAFDAVRSFLVEDVSRYYVTAVRDRVWDGSPTAYDTLGTVLHEGTRLLAPFVPFLADRLYQELDGEAATVHATEFPSVSTKLRDETLEDRVERVRALEEATATARQQAGRKRRWPVLEVVVETDDELLGEAVESYRGLLEQRLNAEYVLNTSAYDRAVETVEPVMDELGPAVGDVAPAVAEQLRTERVTEYPTTVTVEDETVTVTEAMVEQVETTPENVEAVAFEYGTVYVDTSLPTSLKREGVYRDLLRRAQHLRDELGVEMDERVVLAVESDSPVVTEVLKRYRDELATEARATEVVTRADDADATTTVSVDDADVSVGVRRAN
jgi:isoleucyl-tRNA synthetase